MSVETLGGRPQEDLHPIQYEKALICTTSEYSVKLMVSYSSACDGDFLMTMVLLSVSLGGTQHLRNRVARTDDFDGRFYRDDLRRPVSISSIARSLDVAIETVRRKCARLVELGLMNRTANGQVVVMSASLARAEIEAAVRRNRTALHVMLEQIDRTPHAFR